MSCYIQGPRDKGGKTLYSRYTKKWVKSVMPDEQALIREITLKDCIK